MPSASSIELVVFANQATTTPSTVGGWSSRTQRTDFEHGQAPASRRSAGIWRAASSAVRSPADAGDFS